MSEPLGTLYRTHTCGELRPIHVGQDVVPVEVDVVGDVTGHPDGDAREDGEPRVDPRLDRLDVGRDGLFLLFEDQILQGDYVKIGDNKGRITDITFQNVVVVNDLGDVVFIPNNSVFTREVINFSSYWRSTTFSITWHKWSLRRASLRASWTARIQPLTSAVRRASSRRVRMGAAFPPKYENRGLPRRRGQAASTSPAGGRTWIALRVSLCPSQPAVAITPRRWDTGGSLAGPGRPRPRLRARGGRSGSERFPCSILPFSRISSIVDPGRSGASFFPQADAAAAGKSHR